MKKNRIKKEKRLKVKLEALRHLTELTDEALNAARGGYAVSDSPGCTSTNAETDCAGRPFIVGGIARVSRAVPRDGWV